MKFDNMLDKYSKSFLVVGNTDVAFSFVNYLENKGLNVEHCFEDDLIKSIQLFDVISIFSETSIESKIDCIKKLKILYNESLLTINICDERLEDIQDKSSSLILGLNVSLPVQASPFMEVVKTNANTVDSINALLEIGKGTWDLDPYVCDGISIRSYLFATMSREAFSLVDKGYATAESIDRACRNDAGYYLPFVGNFLYMDLMGTMAYSLVMKDLNPELSKEQQLPEWFVSLVNSGNTGLKNNKGIFEYKDGDYEAWVSLLKDYAVDIRQLIDKNRKNY